MDEPVRIQWFELDEFADQHLQLWQNLCTHACAPNFYLSPAFVLPAVRYLTPGEKVHVSTMWQGEELLALGLFVVRPASWRYPFTRLIGYQCKHSFQGGMLIAAHADAAQVALYLRALLGEHVSDRKVVGVQLDELCSDTPLYHRLQAAAKHAGLRWVTERSYHRAALHNPAAAVHLVAKKRRKECERKLRQLSRQGDLRFDVFTSESLPAGFIDTFLAHEQQGKKESSGLAATTVGREFFVELMQHTERLGQAMHCQLTLDGETLASTINFVCGNHGFAFKTSYNPAYASFSPGILVEYHFLRWLELQKIALAGYDSGAQPGSYIERFWPDRTTIASATLLTNGVPALLFELKLAMRQILNRFKRA